MIITVIAVRVVQMAGDEIVDMIAMRNRFVAAARAMNVSSNACGCGWHDAEGCKWSFRYPFLKSVVFAGVRDGVLDELEHVGIGDRLDRVLALAPTLDQTGLQQHLQARRNRAYPVVLSLNEFANVPFPRGQSDEGPEPCGIRQSLEHGCCLLEVRPINRFDHLFHHSIDRWNIAERGSYQGR
jgi:hypothetical protein